MSPSYLLIYNVLEFFRLEYLLKKKSTTNHKK